MSNLISASITTDEVNKVLSDIAEIKKIFSFGIKMTPKERKNIPKIDDSRLSFVEKKSSVW
ncbi:MAG: hypothetical protein IPO21_10360 [Bacteroidales bacterium]|nr:hypothetical protein [Bacteroidales bacterium]